jgi:hypothetical protein
MDFLLSLVAYDAHQETCSRHCKEISSDDATNEAVEQDAKQERVKTKMRLFVS